MAKKYIKDDFLISTDKSLFDLKIIHSFFKTSYWGDNVPHKVMERVIQDSLCFGVYYQHKQIGFARVVTDFSTIGYIVDVFIIEEYRERKLLDWLLMCIFSHPELRTLKRWFLASKEGLYAKFTFAPLKKSPLNNHRNAHSLPLQAVRSS